MHRKLLNLIQDNLQAKREFTIRQEGDEATIYLYDVIDDYFGVNSQEFAGQLAGINASTIHLRINSPGGDVFAGRTMQTALAQHPARVVAHIDGLSASAATVVASGADERRITDGGFYMIHKGWTWQVGNADEMRNTAGLLDKVDDSIANTYARITGMNADEIMQMMADESWLSAQEAKEMGFVDEIVDAERGGQAGTQNRSRFNLQAYSKVPEALSREPEPDFAAARAHLERRLQLIGR